MTSLEAFRTSNNTFRKKISDEFISQPLREERVIDENDVAHLPECVKKYLAYTGALGRSKPQNLYIEFDADMYRKPGDKPMKSHSVQYNFYGNYTRLFLMKAWKMGIPFRALHIYKECQATFRVRVAELFNVVNESGDTLAAAETVTVLNDLCLFAPGCLTDKRLTWSNPDSLSAVVTLTNGKYVVSAKLLFNEKGELENFISDDRSALQEDGSMKKVRWSTPVSDYKEFNGRKIAVEGRTIWHYPEGDFTYGIFRLKSVKYNLYEL